MVPGDLKHWLPRAAIGELERLRAYEMARPELTRSMMLVSAIDEELYKRRSAAADHYGDVFTSLGTADETK
jgi:hypothetical protein